jgi:hypothetical protein
MSTEMFVDGLKLIVSSEEFQFVQRECVDLSDRAKVALGSAGCAGVAVACMGDMRENVSVGDVGCRLWMQDATPRRG